MLERIQSAIVEERNNHGDHSVSGDDLRLAAAMAILWYARHARAGERQRLEEAAERHRETIEGTMPRFVRLMTGD